MSQKSKTYRGQGRNRDKLRWEHHGCCCFLCVGHDIGNNYVLKEKEANKEIERATKYHKSDNEGHPYAQCPICNSMEVVSNGFCYDCNIHIW